MLFYILLNRLNSPIMYFGNCRLLKQASKQNSARRPGSLCSTNGARFPLPADSLYTVPHPGSWLHDISCACVLLLPGSRPLSCQMGAGIFRSAALRDPCAGSVKLDKSWAPYLKGLCLLVFQDVCGWKPAPWLLQFPSDKLTRHLINKQQIAPIAIPPCPFSHFVHQID